MHWPVPESVIQPGSPVVLDLYKTDFVKLAFLFFVLQLRVFYIVHFYCLMGEEICAILG